VFVPEVQVMGPLGQVKRWQTGHDRRRLRARAGRQELTDALIELVGRQPALGHMFAEDGRDLISVSVADQQPSRIRVSFVPTAGLHS
jgi:hypothetical protein